MLKDIINLTAKNFKLAFRSRTSIFTLLFAPIVIILLLGIAFNNSGVYNINIGIYSDEYSDLANSLIEKLNEENFRLVRINSEEYCVDQVKEGTLNLCMVFPRDFKIEEGKTNEIIFHVDPSKVNVVSQVVNIISSKLSTTSESISLNLTTNLLDRITLTTNELTETKPTVEVLKENIKQLTHHNDEIDKAVVKTIDLSDFNISSVATASEEAKNDMVSLVIFMREKIESLRNAVDDVDSAGNGLEENNQQKLDDAVTSLTTDVNAIESEIDSANSDAVANFNQVSAMVSGMEEKFNRIVRILNKINEDNKASKTILKEATASIDAIDKSYNTMMAALTTIGIAQAGSIVNPFTTTIKPVVVQKSHLNYVYAGIIMLIIMFVSILLASTLVMMEKKSKSYLLNYMAPTKDVSFVISAYITVMALMILQAVIIIGVSSYFFKEQIISNLPQISLILLVSMTLFILLGMFIAYFFRAEQTITLVSIAIGSLFLLLSNMILPLEAMPRYFIAIVKFNPFLMAQNMLRRVLMFDASIRSIGKELIILLVFAAVIFILILLNEGLLKRKGIFKFFKRLFGKK